MGRVKDDVIELVRRLPDDVTTLDIMEALYFRQQVEEGLADVAAGRVVSHEEVEAEVKRWRKSAGR
ncbi:MAG: hypothetical protein HYX90_01020 [Chloroflexi bacterium]|nr:hypothetical protein [Chloroflexota bacterium]